MSKPKSEIAKQINQMKITFQADRLSQLNVDRADPANQAPDQNDFNEIVNKFNDLIGQLNTLPDARCCSLT